jgi:hypothetical protein
MLTEPLDRLTVGLIALGIVVGWTVLSYWAGYRAGKARGYDEGRMGVWRAR